MKLIIEKIFECKLVKTGYESNGHDCWGNHEYSSYNYVLLENKEERVWDSNFIIHNDKEVLGVAYDFNLDFEIQKIKQKQSDKLQFKLF